jgi:hypothetical protein
MTPCGGPLGSPHELAHHVTNHADEPGHDGEGWPPKPKSPGSAGALSFLQ